MQIRRYFNKICDNIYYRIFCCNMFVFACPMIAKSQFWLFLKYQYLPSYIRISPLIQLPVSAQWSQRSYVKVQGGGTGGSMSYVVGSNSSYNLITNTAWVRAQLCKLQKGCTRRTAASDKAYQLLAQGRWFSPGTPASSTTKTGRHDIAEILLKVAWKSQCVEKVNVKYVINRLWHVIFHIIPGISPRPISALQYRVSGLIWEFRANTRADMENVV